MLPAESLDRTSIQCLRRVVESIYVARDDLDAVADALDDLAMANICRELAGQLDDQSRALKQLIAQQGEIPPQSDPLSRRMQKVIVQILKRHHGPASMLAEAEACQHQLRQAYQRAMEDSEDELRSLLRRHRDQVAAGESRIHRLRHAAETRP